MTPTLIFRDKFREAELKTLCTAVLDNFQLPTQSLVCIFDDKERPEFLDTPQIGPNFCGFHNPVRQFRFQGVPWPPELRAHLWDTQRKEFAFDAVIYMRKRTCDSDIGTVITFGHGLQHFLQYGSQYKAWRASQFIANIAAPKLVNSRPWSFPHEHQAQLVAKRVAETVLGPANVQSYAKEQAAHRGDREKWLFFLSVDASKAYNLTEETNIWVEEYRAELIERHSYLATKPHEPNFSSPRWWE